MRRDPISGLWLPEARGFRRGPFYHGRQPGRSRGVGSGGAKPGNVVTVVSEDFPTPDLLNNVSFESGWDGFEDWASGDPSGVTRETDLSYDGSTSVEFPWTPNPSSDIGSQFSYDFGDEDRVWVRFYFRLTAPISSIFKFARFFDTGFSNNYGGLFAGSGGNILTWGWDQENSAIVTEIGLQQADVADSNWHSIEFDYWRNGDPSGFPSVAFWFDGEQAIGSDPTKYFGAGNSSVWSGGRLNAGERSLSSQISLITMAATLNAGNTTTGQVNFDRIAVSSTGRIGP